VKASPERLEAVKKAFHTKGAEVKAFYNLMGEYDSRPRCVEAGCQTCGKLSSLDTASCADCVAERGGFEPPVSREVFPKENTPECWDILGRNPLASCGERVRFQIATVSVVKLKFRCREKAAGSKNPVRRSQVFYGPRVAGPTLSLLTWAHRISDGL
jgi:hypothetical protein